MPPALAASIAGAGVDAMIVDMTQRGNQVENRGTAGAADGKALSVNQYPMRRRDGAAFPALDAGDLVSCLLAKPAHRHIYPSKAVRRPQIPDAGGVWRTGENDL